MSLVLLIDLVSAHWIFGEPVHAAQLAGIVVMVGGVALIAGAGGRKRSPSLARYWICVDVGVLVTGVVQTLLRLGSRKPTSGFVQGGLRREVIAGFGPFFVVTLLNVYAMRMIPLRTMTAWSALTYPG